MLDKDNQESVCGVMIHVRLRSHVGSTLFNERERE